MKKSVNSLRTGAHSVAIVVFSLLVGLFADYGQTVPAVASWLAKVRIFPAAMAFSLATFVIWLIVTLLFWPNLLLDILSAWYISGSLFPFTPYAQARQAPLALSLFFASHFIAPHFVVYCGTFDLSWHFSGDIIF